MYLHSPIHLRGLVLSYAQEHLHLILSFTVILPDNSEAFRNTFLSTIVHQTTFKVSKQLINWGYLEATEAVIGQWGGRSRSRHRED
jgi:hypothetical protein